MSATTEKPSTPAREVAVLDQMTTQDHRDEYAEAFGEPTTAWNCGWLARRVGWRLRSYAERDLRDCTKAQAAKLARVTALRLTPTGLPPLINYATSRQGI